MGFYPNRKPITLSDEHRRTQPAAAADVIAERGTYSARRGADVPQESGWLPKKPGIVFQVHTLDGEVFPRLRLDNPGLLPKYMQPKGHPNRLDLHPRQHERIKQPGGMRYVTEGEKKVDAGVSRGLLMVGLSGVWNGQKDKELIPDWYLLPLAGECYSILFDSDIETNPDVQMAADRQARLLQENGAEVFITLLPPAPDGSKQGLDDFFAAGGTVKELELLTRPYSIRAVEKVRLTRDKKLRITAEALERKWWDFEWPRLIGTGERPNSQRGHTVRDVVRSLLDRVPRSGKLTAEGVLVTVSIRTLAVEAAKSKPATIAAVKHAEAEGWLRIHYPENKRKAASYVLVVNRATLDHIERGQAGHEGTREVDARRGKELRAPRLRWSSPGCKAHKRTVKGTRRVRQMKLPARQFIKRLGPCRGAVVDALITEDGTATLAQLCEILHRSRPRDLARRVLPMLEKAGIITVDGDIISLTSEWEEALHYERELKGEIAVARRDAHRYRDQSKAYREWESGKHQVSKHWTNKPGADGHIEDLQRVGDALSDEDRRTLEAIEAFEQKYGRGSFGWDRASCKELFYSGPIRGFWPEPEELRRIRDYLIATRGVAA